MTGTFGQSWVISENVCSYWLLYKGSMFTSLRLEKAWYSGGKPKGESRFFNFSNNCKHSKATQRKIEDLRWSSKRNSDNKREKNVSEVKSRSKLHPSIHPSISPFMHSPIPPFIPPSIHPSSTANPWSRRGGSSFSRRPETSLYPTTSTISD